MDELERDLADGDDEVMDDTEDADPVIEPAAEPGDGLTEESMTEVDE